MQFPRDKIGRLVKTCTLFIVLFNLTFIPNAQATEIDGSFITVAGISVKMPMIEGLTCPQLREVLAEIDATGYRGSAPEPHHQEDQPLFNYETRVAEAHYGKCANEAVDTLNSSEATFKRAFQSSTD